MLFTFLTCLLGAESKTVFKKWLDEGKSLMWIDHHKGIIEDSKTWGFTVPGLRRVGVGACALASDLLMGEGAGDRPVSVRLRFGGGGHAGAAGFVLDVSSDQFKDFLENHKLTSIR